MNEKKKRILEALDISFLPIFFFFLLLCLLIFERDLILPSLLLPHTKIPQFFNYYIPSQREAVKLRKCSRDRKADIISLYCIIFFFPSSFLKGAPFSNIKKEEEEKSRSKRRKEKKISGKKRVVGGKYVSRMSTIIQIQTIFFFSNRIFFSAEM